MLTFSRILGAAAGFILAGTLSSAEPQHGIAMYGDPALPPDFAHLPYANPDAPVGGRIVVANVGSFDSLNPYIQQGNVPWQIRFWTGESLMGRSLDEPFSLYGVLAETIETGPNREWVEFTLRPEARFSDGSPVTVADVIWSYETLGTIGHPRYASFYSKIETIEQTGDRSVRITFDVEDRELVLLAGLRPILQMAQYEGIDFAESHGTDIIPITSGRYIIAEAEAGRFVSLQRNPDYWGDGIVPFMQGVGNFDEVRIEFFGDETTAFEAFKVGEVTTNREFNAGRWDTQYDFPRVESGEVTLSVLPHYRPSGMTGFVMNSRQPQFEDWRVRQAMIEVFNFEIINDAVTGGASPRIVSYFGNSPLGMETGAAEGRVLEFLQEYEAELLPGAIEGYTLPVSDGTARNRDGIQRAISLMEEAGYTIQGGVMADADGTPFTFEILMEIGGGENQTIINMYVQQLERIGVAATLSLADDAAYNERASVYDFDMTYFRRGLSLSPGNEQYLYWGSESADVEGGRNMMGVRSEAVDALIGRLLTSESQDDFLAAARALDRVLMSGRYVIPIYQWNISRVAHDTNLHYPETIPLFGDWPGWQPEVWWYEE